MPIYISRGRFTSNAIKGMLAKPENREDAVAKLFKSVGGKLIGWLCVLKTRFGNSGDEGRRGRAQIRCSPRAGWRDGSERLC